MPPDQSKQGIVLSTLNHRKMPREPLGPAAPLLLLVLDALLPLAYLQSTVSWSRSVSLKMEPESNKGQS